MNISDPVAALLTRRGAFMVNEQNRELMYRFPQQKLKADYKAGDYYEQYLWVLMKHFGSEFCLGREAPFTDIFPIEPRGFREGTTTPDPQPLEAV